MKVKVTFTEKHLVEMIETTIKNKFSNMELEFGNLNIIVIPADRDGPAYLKGVEIVVEFK